MESLMKEVAAAADGSSSSQQGAAPGGMHPGIAERMNIQEVNPGSGGGTQQRQQPPGPGAPAPTPEQQQQMLEFLEGLQELQSTDPAEFDKAMASLLGIPAGAGADAISSQQKSESLSSMIAGIQSMREGGSGVLGGMAAGAGGDGVNITGSKQPEQKGIYITPEPGFVVKTRNTRSNATKNVPPSSSALVESHSSSNSNSNSSSSSKVVELDDEEGGQKVFINICVHEEVGAPGMKKRLDANGEEQEGMNIPMSVGQGRVGEDKSGGACLVYDIIVNKKVLEECKEDKSGKYRDFVCQLGMQCLEQKFSLILDRRYKLPKLKYQPAADGKVDQQYIKDRKSSPQIEEVAENSETASKAAQARLKQKREQEKALQEATKLAEVALPHSLSWTSSADAAGVSSNNNHISESGETGENQGALDGPEVGLPSLSGLMQGGAGEYREPIYQVQHEKEKGSSKKYAVCVLAQVANAHALSTKDVSIKASPYRLTLKVPRYKLLTVYLPVSVDPALISCSLRRREGFAGVVDLCVVMPLDTSDWGAAADPGSKPWLMENALKSDVVSDGAAAGAAGLTAANPYVVSASASSHGSSSSSDSTDGNSDTSGANEGGDSSNSAPEDVYHLRGNSTNGNNNGSDKPVFDNNGRGILHAEEEDVELPEDRFHKADASSSYYIQQREQAVKDKWDKADREREDRRKNPDPNVEYIDMDDYKPGGKMAPPVEEGSDVAVALAADAAKSETMQKASAVVAASAVNNPALEGLSLSSTVWTELLD